MKRILVFILLLGIAASSFFGCASEDIIILSKQETHLVKESEELPCFSLKEQGTEVYSLSSEAKNGEIKKVLSDRASIQEYLSFSDENMNGLLTILALGYPMNRLLSIYSGSPVTTLSQADLYAGTECALRSFILKEELPSSDGSKEGNLAAAYAEKLLECAANEDYSVYLNQIQVKEYGNSSLSYDSGSVNCLIEFPLVVYKYTEIYAHYENLPEGAMINETAVSGTNAVFEDQTTDILLYQEEEEKERKILLITVSIPSDADVSEFTLELYVHGSCEDIQLSGYVTENRGVESLFVRAEKVPISQVAVWKRTVRLNIED